VADIKYMECGHTVEEKEQTCIKCAKELLIECDEFISVAYFAANDDDNEARELRKKLKTFLKLI